MNIDIVPAPDEGKARIAFQTFDDAEIHYTLDGSVPDVQSPLYTDTIQVDKDVYHTSHCSSSAGCQSDK